MTATAGTLYVVATPIGNLSDLTPRAAATLAAVDMIAAEDTRHTRKLLSFLQINTPLHACHAHNEANKGAFFVRELLAGKNIALVSDAGTPCISDPGHLLISAATAAGVTVTPICGVSAVVAALSVSGFEGSKFSFCGFFSRKTGEMLHTLQTMLNRREAFVFYESPNRIAKTMALFAQHAPLLQICLCNDISKKFERIYRGTPAEVLAQLTANPDAQKGEYACVAHPGATPVQAAPQAAALSPEAQLVDIMVKQNCDLKTAAAHLHAQRTGHKKKDIYSAMLRLKANFCSEGE